MRSVYLSVYDHNSLILAEDAPYSVDVKSLGVGRYRGGKPNNGLRQHLAEVKLASASNRRTLLAALPRAAFR